MNSQNAGGTSLPILQGSIKYNDPVCGMEVVPEKAAAKVAHDGNTYYFCSKGCAERFSRAPEKFLVASGTAAMSHAHAHAKHEAKQQSRSSTSRSTIDEKKIR